MSLLTNFFGLFGKNGVNHNNVNEVESSVDNHLDSDVITSQDIPLKDIFINNKPPVSESESVMEHNYTSDSTPIDDVINKNWFNIGYDDGYLQSSSAVKNTRIEFIKSEIIQAICKHIDVYEEDLSKKEIELSDIEEDNDLKEVVNGYKTRITQIQKKISNLFLEKENIQLGKDGKFCSPIYDYKNGFIEGISDKIRKDDVRDSIMNQ